MPSVDPPLGVIPTSPDEFTATWLAAILTRSGYSAAIESLEFPPIEVSALTSEIVRVVPRFQDETTGVAPALLWKRSVDDPEARQAFQRGYAQEVHFYREVAPTVKVAAPRCFAAGHDTESGAHVLLLEDMAPAAAGDFLEGVSPERAADVLRELAALHAARWTNTGNARPAEAFASLNALVERWAPVSEPFLSEHVDDRAVERTSRYATEVADIFASLSAGPQSLTHGDAHPGNVLFAPDEAARPVLVDWQGSHVDAPLRDVARFLVLGLTVEDRRAHEAALLDGYLANLDVHGVRYDRDAAALDYLNVLLLQWGWAVIFFRLESSWDPATRAAMPALVGRAAAAFDDATARLDRRE